MRRTRLPIEKPLGPHGFTKWFAPTMGGYYLACCDCGLTHKFQFRIVQEGKRQAVEIRARRAPRYTAMQRRSLKAR